MPVEKHDVGQCGGVAASVVMERSISHYDEGGVWNCRREPHESVRTFDASEATDEPDQHAVHGQAERRTCLCLVVSFHRLGRRQDHRRTLLAHHTCLQQVAPRGRTDHQRVGRHGTQEPFDRGERSSNERREVAVQEMPVVRVHPHRHTGDHGGDPADHSGFGHVGVHDVGSQPAQCSNQSEQRADLTDEAQRPAQIADRDDLRRDRSSREIVTLAGDWCTAHYRLRESVAVEPVEQVDQHHRRPADVRARQDVDDANHR